MTSKSNDRQQRDLRFTLADLEQLTTHEVAELLSNVVLLLRRLPDVPLSELQASERAWEKCEGQA